MAPRIGITTSPHEHRDRYLEALDRAYVNAVARAGGLPLVIPVLDPRHAVGMVSALDGLLVTGGADIDPACYGGTSVPEVYGVDPARDEWELALFRQAAAARIPILGICRGAQLMNVARGGSLLLDLPSMGRPGHRQMDRMNEGVHDVAIASGSILESVVGVSDDSVLGVNSLHHQAVDRVGTGFAISAVAHDGTVEAIEATDGSPILGVQWHPELLVDATRHAALFSWLTHHAARPRLDPVEFDEALADSVV